MTTVEDSPLLRAALMEIDPGYFALSTEDRERYRANPPDGVLERVTRRVRAELFGKDRADTQGDEDGRLSFAEEQRLIEAMLPLQGVGEDCFRLNEQLYGRTLLDYATLADYCRADHDYQETWRAKERAGYARKPWRGPLEPVGAWLFLDGAYTYAQSQSAAGRIRDALHEHGRNLINEALPHRLVEGPRHGEPVHGGYLCDLVLDANGREAEVRALETAFWAWIEAAGEALLDEWAARNLRRVWILDATDIWGRGVDFVFSDPAALEAVRLRRFVADCRTIEAADETALDQCAASWMARLEGWMTEQLAVSG